MAKTKQVYDLLAKASSHMADGAKLQRPSLAILLTNATLDIVQDRVTTRDVPGPTKYLTSDKFGGKPIFDKDDGIPEWFPPLRLGFSANLHGADQDMGGKVVHSEGTSFLVWLSMLHAWEVSKDKLYVFVGVDFALGQRTTHFKHVEARDKVTLSGFTFLGGGRVGFNLFHYMSLYGFARGSHPSGGQFGGGVVLTKVPYFNEIGIEAGHEFLDTPSCGGICTDETVVFEGPFVAFKVLLAVFN